ncbi:OST-HTH/LOTUS domain-containing protein [Stenotrophomonas tuberculopleuritidis]|uniref:OST-HTH/LOTUS domain-containing protein n=1 Tax=Stenotrophomonas tuberculopleuritidis TaxID=3055079 RepID=UPI0026E54607|nr:OST-HTH/LOTUS domain-containing protein [Stenotrophomonas sp. 704A1]
MPAIDQNDIVGAQHEVQRLLGRCILRLQQCEQLMKSMLVHQEWSGTLKTLPVALDNRKAKFGGKTMGMLVGHLTAECVVKEGSAPPGEPSDYDANPCSISSHTRISLPAESHAALQTDLRELVNLRNTLVHHFIEQHDLWTVEGCLQAQGALSSAYTRVDQQLQRLCPIAEGMDEVRREFAERLRSPMAHEFVVNGIAPDGQIHWPIAGVVSALRQACRERSIDGWLNLDTAVRWVSEHHPEQTPKKYGCARWRHVIHESKQFDLRHFTHNGQFGAWLRERVNSPS